MLKEGDLKAGNQLKIRRRAWIGVLIIFFLGVLAYSVRLSFLAHDTIVSGRLIHAELQNSAAAAKNFDIDSAYSGIVSASGKLANISDQIAEEPVIGFSFRAIPQLFKNLSSFSKTALGLGGNFLQIIQNGPTWIMDKQGELLIDRLKLLKEDLIAVEGAGEAVKSSSAAAGFTISEASNSANGAIFQTRQILEAFLGWLEKPSDRHLVLLFQNISEMRPTGGFIGSYAVATINRGSLVNFVVDDIYNPDGQLKIKVKPPVPLQGITGVWGARDANWFPDAPTSFAKVIEFLEASQTYRDQKIVFDGAIMINTHFLADLLKITGPIYLPEYDLVVDERNALDAIQQEVRAGKDRPTDPKRILKILAPEIIQKIRTLEAEEQAKLLKLIQDHARAKNIIVYFEDLVIQNFLKSLGVAGEVYDLSKDHLGDYFLVVNSNIASGKTDAVINQEIRLESVITKNGFVSNKLIISRSHQGEEKSEWWYRTANKNYLQIFVPPQARLNKISGGQDLTPKPFVSYATGYLFDPELEAFERADTVFGKRVFSTWLNTEPGTTDVAIFEYNVPVNEEIFSGRPYTLIFDKQSGVRGGVKISVKAPSGYLIRPANSEGPPSRTYEHFAAEPSARLEIPLILSAEEPRQ